MVRRLEADEWKVFREIRLAALRDAPYAFGSTYGAELVANENSWRSRLEARARFVAQSGREVIGTVAGGSSGSSGIAALTALWVAPAARGRGIGEALVMAVLAWARDAAYEHLALWVVEGNSPAEKLYDRMGFTRTGAAQPVRPGDDRIEYEMSRTL